MTFNFMFAFVFLVIGYYTMFKQSLWFLVGYNFNKKNPTDSGLYDIEKLCKFFGFFYFGMGVAQLFVSIGLAINYPLVQYIGWGAWFAFAILFSIFSMRKKFFVK